ncbi:MAG: hypothetical protein ABDK87_04985 [Atribacterota bacterium]
MAQMRGPFASYILKLPRGLSILLQYPLSRKSEDALKAETQRLQP